MSLTSSRLTIKSGCPVRAGEIEICSAYSFRAFLCFSGRVASLQPNFTKDPIFEYFTLVFICVC
jgi:hypothetical protein